MGNVKKGIYRDSKKRIIGGVCSGLSYYFNIDRVLIRLLFVIMVFFFMVAIPLYLILWAIIPKARTQEEKLEMTGERDIYKKQQLVIIKFIFIQENMKMEKLEKFLLTQAKKESW